ncbi:hypothetical protein [Oceanobacter kriegii]|uniref:hypothetical protein n=1 Tax=Oceanobacter kriegii TaxID=64972 RepID=UPI000423F35A|nr:hypothetical protein [Oceanobacter kriegii]
MEAAQNLGICYPAQIAASAATSAGWQVRLLNTTVAPDSTDIEKTEGDRKIKLFAENLMPTVVHMANFYHLPLAQTLNLVYLDCTRSLGECAATLLGVLRSLSGKNEAWVPLAASHSMLMNALRMLAPELLRLDLRHAPLLYIGDYANFAAVRELGHDGQMPVFCQATY